MQMSTCWNPADKFQQNNMIDRIRSDIDRCYLFAIHLERSAEKFNRFANHLMQNGLHLPLASFATFKSWLLLTEWGSCWDYNIDRSPQIEFDWICEANTQWGANLATLSALYNLAYRQMEITRTLGVRPMVVICGASCTSWRFIL